MANESTYGSVSALIASIYENAWLTAREQSIMAPLVTGFGADGLTPRVLGQYSGGTIATITENTDMTAQAFIKTPYGTLTPAMYGAQYFINDTRIASDPQAVIQDAGRDLGQLMAVQVDTHLVGLFSSFTGGTVGTAGGTLTWANLLRANAYLRAQHAPFPFYAVLRPEQWYYLASATSIPDLIVSDVLKNSMAGQFYVGGWGGMEFFIDANITGGTASVAGMFARAAAALDTRRAFRIEAERDASRGGGGYELNATMIYAYGVNRPLFGCQMIGTSS